MNIEQPTPLLGGLSPQAFMRRHWQRKPLLIRGAIEGFKPLLSRAELFKLACSEGVESRLIVRKAPAKTPKRTQSTQVGDWTLARGPLTKAQLPPTSQPTWTLLVQGVDTHDDAVHQLMRRFSFVPDARLDDVMISYATDGGGVGPHTDNYDVFLLQAHGQRRWRIGKRYDPTLVPDVPLKLLANFAPEEEFVLNPGDMLYLPPGYAHDGIAVGECMTYSIGFKVSTRRELGVALLQRMVDQLADELPCGTTQQPAKGRGADPLYTDAGGDATDAPGAVPPALQQFARDAVARCVSMLEASDLALGEFLTEPKANVWFEGGDAPPDWTQTGVRLHRASRAMFDAKHFFINGEGFRVAGRDQRLLQALANARELSAAQLQQASDDVLEQLDVWCDAGWVQVPNAFTKP